MDLRAVYEKETKKFPLDFHHKGMMEWEQFSDKYVIWLEKQLTYYIRTFTKGKLNPFKEMQDKS